MRLDLPVGTSSDLTGPIRAAVILFQVARNGTKMLAPSGPSLFIWEMSVNTSLHYHLHVPTLTISGGGALSGSYFMATRSSKPSVFISYSEKDKNIALEIAKKLKKANSVVWMDRASLVPGEDFHLGINHALKSAGIVLLLVSTTSMSSAWVTYEWAFAFGSGKRVIPVHIEQMKLAGLHPILTTIHYVNFTDERRPWSVLLKSLVGPQATAFKDLELSDQVSEPRIEATFQLEADGTPKQNLNSEFRIDLRVINAPQDTKIVTYEILFEGF